MRQPPHPPRVAIIGAGFSGLCLGIELRRAGLDSFVIFEKSDGVGGTWRDNTYPGAACDSPSFVYCFSFEQKLDWSRKWAPQPEILAYLEHCARKYDLLPHLRFRTEIAGARFDAGRGLWQIRTTAGEEVQAEVLVSAVGQLNRPHVPPIPGIGAFRGAWFHSARWNHACPLSGRSVAVIGNAASAIQLIPPVAKQAGRLTVFQRSANWMIPKLDREYSERAKRRFARHPWLARLHRWWIWAMYGPNTNLGHNSIPFMIECQARYILGCIRAIAERRLLSLDLRPEVLEAWDAQVQADLARTVWAATDHSWYKNAQGRITNNWSGTTTRYWWRTRRVDLRNYHLDPAPAPAGAAAGRDPATATGIGA